LPEQGLDHNDIENNNIVHALIKSSKTEYFIESESLNLELQLSHEFLIATHLLNDKANDKSNLGILDHISNIHGKNNDLKFCLTH